MGAWEKMPALPDHWAIIEEADEVHPFRLATSPSRSFLNTTFNETPSSQAREGAPTVKMHPADAAALAISDGDAVTLGNTRGETTLTARLFDGVRRGVLIAESVHPNKHHIGGHGINMLTGAEAVAPIGGAAFHDNKVWVKKAGAAATRARLKCPCSCPRSHRKWFRTGSQRASRVMTDSNSVLLEKRGQAFWITINRPDKRNAINADVVAGIARGYREAHDDRDVRVIVLTGAGDKAFCAGADLQNSGAAFAMDFSRPNVDYADLLRLSQNATKPSVARVGGVCMAGGMGLLCMTDMAVAADHVIFGLPEVKVGVFPMQVLSLLQAIAPRRLVNEWALTGEPFDARTAHAAGLVNHVVPSAELDAKVDWLIGRIVDKSPTAIRRGKYAMRAIASMSFDESIAYTESQIALLAMTEDAKEGLKAFGEKRKPSWPGK